MAGQQTGTKHSLWDQRRSVDNRGYSTEMIYSDSNRNYDSGGEKIWQAGIGKVCSTNGVWESQASAAGENGFRPNQKWLWKDTPRLFKWVYLAYVEFELS